MRSAYSHSNTIVVGVELSEPSYHALEKATRIALGADAKLVIAHFLYDEEMAQVKR